MNIKILTLILISSLALDSLANTMNFHGMCWVNPVDSSVGPNGDGLAWPDGMTGNESYEQAYALGQAAGNAVISQGGNTVRIPITPQMATGVNWWRYGGIINGLGSTGCNVILCYWTTNNQVADVNTWYAMWDTVNGSFGSANNVFYEPINEPVNQSNLNDLYAGFLARYNPPQNKCLLDGSGYAQDVNSLGADSRLANQLLALHVYFWFSTYNSPTSTSAAYNDTAAADGSYANRTVITEMGVQTDGRSQPAFWQVFGNNLETDVATLNGALQWARDNSVGTIQFSGINSQNLYHWFTGSLTNNLTVASSDVAKMFQWSWGEYAPPAQQGVFKIISRNSGLALDAANAYTSNGTLIDQYWWWGGANQQWTLVSLGGDLYSIIGVESGRSLDIANNSSANGALLQLWDFWGGPNQKFAIDPTDSGFYRITPQDNTSSALDVQNDSTSPGALVQQYSWWGGYNQQWEFVAPEIQGE